MSFFLAQVEATMKKYAFNRWASDKMSLKRQLPDVRHATCRTIEYDKDLPSVSGIVASPLRWSIPLKLGGERQDSDYKIVRDPSATG